LDEAHQLTIHTADFLRALAVAPELFVLTKPEELLETNV
jgi:hypothetical protein